MLGRISSSINVVVCALATGLVATHAYAAQPTTARLTHENAKQKIAELKWHQEEDLPIQEESFVILQGNFVKADWNLLWKAKALAMSKSGDFRLKVPLTGEKTEVSVAAISPEGQVQEEKITLVATGFISPSKNKGPEANPHSYVPGLGLTFINYTEENKPDFSEAVLTAKINYRCVINPTWDLGANMFVSAFQLSSNLPGAFARFFGANFRAGYTFKNVPRPWGVMI